MGTLSIYASAMDSSFQTAENFIASTAANDNDFQSVIYAKSKTEAYLASKIVSEKCLPLIKADDIFCGLLTYSAAFDCWYIIRTASYPQEDLTRIRNSVVTAADADYFSSGWQPLRLSDRTIYLYFITNHATTAAAIVDPNRQYHSGLEQDHQIFFTLPTGEPLAPENTFGDTSLPVSAREATICQTQSGGKYTLISLPLDMVDSYIVYASPYKDFFGQFNLTQQILFIATICLLSSIPFCWLLLRGLLLKPLNSLTATTREIQAGNTQTRVPECSRINEVNAIAQTVNTMLDTIQQQKIDTYEKQLETQRAQMQYLQLQIRPHFYLNCLNLIYSLAEEQKIDAIQEVTLDLSAYLRNIFKESTTLIPLATELKSVESYMRIQGVAVESPPCLKISTVPEASDIMIPPLSILTFVENAVKHGEQDGQPLTVRIKCVLLDSNEDHYLDIVITDNGGGFPEDQLAALNTDDDQIYRDRHVGIPNIRQRLRFLYGNKAVLVFRNVTDCACVELFLPVSEREKEENDHDSAFS